MGRHAESATALQCPRCGYDQSGAVAAWAETCPLQSPCTECGLPLDWGELHRQDPFIAGWWVEGARSWGQVVVDGLFAPVPSVLPWWLWSRVTMRHRLRLWRLVVAIVLWLLVLHLYLARPVIARVAVATPPNMPALDTFTTVASGLSPIGIPFGSAARSQMWVQWMWQDRLEEVRQSLLAIGFAAAAQGIAAVTFAVLPQSRRRAKVRLAHLLRAAAAAILSVPIAVLSFQGVVGFAYLIGWGGTQRSIWIIAPAIFAWHIWWWHATARRYLRMHAPLAIGLSVGVIGVLTAPIVVGGLTVLGRLLIVP